MTYVDLSMNDAAEILWSVYDCSIKSFEVLTYSVHYKYNRTISMCKRIDYRLFLKLSAHMVVTWWTRYYENTGNTLQPVINMIRKIRKRMFMKGVWIEALNCGFSCKRLCVNGFLWESNGTDWKYIYSMFCRLTIFMENEEIFMDTKRGFANFKFVLM